MESMGNKQMKAHLKQRQETIKSRRQKRKIARQARLRRQILRYSSLLILISLGASCLIFLPWKMKDINQDIHINGNIVTSDKQIKNVLANYAGISIQNIPIYKLDPQKLEKEICSLESVNHAFVRRYLFPCPHLEIVILEEFPWASYADAPDQNISGVIAQTGRFVPVSKFPQVIQPNLKFIGKKASHMKESDIKQWALWTNYIVDETGQSVKYVDLREEDNIWVETDNLRLKLGSADINLNKRLGRLASVLPSLNTINQHVDYIDLSLDSNVPVKVSKKTNSPILGN
jgi:cell division septal protein FtsQ